MTNPKRLRRAMVIFCVFVVAATLGYYLKSTGYKPSGSSSSVGWLMLMVAAAVLAAASRRRRQPGEINQKANKTNT